MLGKNKNRYRMKEYHMNRERVNKNRRTKPLNRRYQVRRRKQQMIVIAVIMLVLVVGGIGGFLWWNRGADNEEVTNAGNLDIHLQTEVQEALTQQTLQDLLSQESQEDTSYKAEQVQVYVDSMSLAQKVGSVLMVTADDLADIQIAIQAGNQTKERIQQYPVGGIHYKEHNFENTDQMKLMLNNTMIYSDIPLLFAADSTMKIRVENTGSTLTDVGFQVDASGETWLWMKDESDKSLDTVMSLVKYDGTKTATQLIQDGADMIYIEGEFEEVYQSLLSDVQNGVLTEEVLTNHVQKIMELRM